MNTDEAREYLKDISKSEYNSYIDSRLAGDFAVSISEIMLKMRGALDRSYKSKMTPMCNFCKETDCCISLDDTCEMIRKYQMYSDNNSL